ncbi:MAG: lysylphosphatidylglycerol synthase domain-containing protein, partial [Dehalococcoidia bacterium]|nr:lysylphosphatidylglycerol synthase domain-containing protein [Dehalococcoidia bacterium]
ATFILAVATLAGALFLTPGGLGAAEGAMAGFLRVVVGAPASIGAAATLLIRACTLWFGVALGALALVYYVQTRLKATPRSPDSVGPSPAPPTP